jgi:hypothetical protein
MPWVEECRRSAYLLLSTKPTFESAQIQWAMGGSRSMGIDDGEISTTSASDKSWTRLG